MRSTKGLKRKIEDGTFYVRRAVPDDVRHVLKKGELVESLQTSDSRQAELRRDEVWRRWTDLIEEARRTGAAAPDNLALVLTAVENWRRKRCDAALGVEFQKPFDLTPIVLPANAISAIGEVIRERYEGRVEISPESCARPTAPSIGNGAAAVARRYFEEHPDASREVQIPYTVGVLLGRLQVAERDPEAWRNVDGFDEALDTALTGSGVAFKLTLRLREAARHPFAKAWLEVVRHEEAERQRAAAFLAAMDAARMNAVAVRAQPAPTSYVPREDDHTLAELITVYRDDRSGRHGEESTGRKYNHIFAALEQALGREKPLRAILPEDCQKVRDLIRALPVHASKRYRGMTMAEAIEAADDDEARRLAPNTVNSYMSNLISMFNWAFRVRHWMDFNPAAGLVSDDLPLLERRAFEADELDKIFDPLPAEKDQTPWKYWVPALGLFTGARLNEICQLTKDDVCEYGGVHYLRMSVFDQSGRRSPDKRLKTAPSKRNVPLHPQLIAAGLLDYVASVEDGGRLFPELPRGPNGGYSHYASTWFGTLLDRLGLSDPCLVFHSFRHGFKEACQRADLQDSVWHALGGWAAANVAEKYGRRDAVPILHEAIKKVTFGGFRLVDAEEEPALAA